MALPTNVGFGTVTWRSIDSIGVNSTGTVTFTPSPKKLLNVTAAPSPVTILPKPVVVDLVDGSFSQALVATDDPQNNPAGWTYKVTFKLDGVVVDPFDIEVPEGATVDLSVVAPVSSGNGTMIMRGEGVVAGGTAGQVLAKASTDDYDTEWVDPATGGGGAVDSVNGQTGVVVLDADDLVDGTTNHVFTAADDTKLAGVATGATANSSDATLLARANHTGTQAQSTVTNLTTDLAAKAATVHTHAEADVTGLTTALAGKVPTTRTVAGKALSANVTLVKGDVGLGNVDNTSDAAKPISTATQTALDGKKASTYTPPIADLPAGTMLAARWTGVAWPARPTARTDLVVHWLSSDPAATNPPAGALSVDVITIANA